MSDYTPSRSAVEALFDPSQWNVVSYIFDELETEAIEQIRRGNDQAKVHQSVIFLQLISRIQSEFDQLATQYDIKVKDLWTRPHR